MLNFHHSGHQLAVSLTKSQCVTVILSKLHFWDSTKWHSDFIKFTLF